MRDTYEYQPSLPRVVDVPHPYIGIGDLLVVSQRFDPFVAAGDVEYLQHDLFSIQQKIVPAEVSFIATSASEMNKQLEEIGLIEVNRPEKKVGVVIIDRYIASDTSHPFIFKLNVSRDTNTKLVSRPGAEKDVSEQHKNISQWREENKFDEIVIMDDVVGVGSTMIQTVRELRRAIPKQKIRIIAGIATSGGGGLVRHGKGL